MSLCGSVVVYICKKEYNLINRTNKELSMRFKIELQLKDKRNVLPINYQYPLSSWIYKTLSNANKEFADFLHGTGYQLENKKTFKLFTFSEIQIPKGKWKIIPDSDRIQIWAETISFKIAFQLPEQTESFISGLFQKQNGSIGDSISQIQFQVKQIERLKDSENKNTPIKLRTLSPVVISENIEGRKHESYLNPNSENYEKLLINNLRDKHRALQIKNKLKQIEIKESSIKFIINKENIKRKKITIKAHTQNAVDVIAYKYEFELLAPPEIANILLNSGLGSMNSMGFGMCAVQQAE